ncbi:uncharacterized protein LOC124980268 isoform X2 [Sciurus carolinensis]|uniref:uncharacterized protein LOC124980268 isoform X2 n=1 Tax=Sciurus carolinensis TaxID=30640 RepID=UPI001FB4070E|nr:uncharacterized protein LOC124980268 isoform X2 [Sciurus carolinensis]
MGALERDALSAAMLNPQGTHCPLPGKRPGTSRPAPKGRRTSEAYVQFCAGRGCARIAAGHPPRRGFKCVPALDTTALRVSSSLPSPVPGFRVPHYPGDLSPASPPRWAARSGLESRRQRAPRCHNLDPTLPPPGPTPEGLLRAQRRSSAGKRSLASSPRCSKWTRESAGSGSSCAFADRPCFTQEMQLPPKSCLPLPPKAPRSCLARLLLFLLCL